MKSSRHIDKKRHAYFAIVGNEEREEGNKGEVTGGK